MVNALNSFIQATPNSVGKIKIYDAEGNKIAEQPLWSYGILVTNFTVKFTMNAATE
jgi:hypothetical protein